MARTDITLITGLRAGVAAGASAGAVETTGDTINGMQFLNDGRILISVRITSTAANTITTLIPPTPATIDSNAQTVVGKSVTAGLLDTINKTAFFGPFPTGIYNQADGKVYLDMVGGPNMKFQLIQLPA